MVINRSVEQPQGVGIQGISTPSPPKVLILQSNQSLTIFSYITLSSLKIEKCDRLDVARHMQNMSNEQRKRWSHFNNNIQTNRKTKFIKYK